MKVQAYKCYQCRNLFENEHSYKWHMKSHARERLANYMLKKGNTIAKINKSCDFNWRLDENQKNITKANCFTISYLQCCNLPAYKICRITGSGGIIVAGKGGWSGGYSSEVGMHCLKEPFPEECLYVAK